MDCAHHMVSVSSIGSEPSAATARTGASECLTMVTASSACSSLGSRIASRTASGASPDEEEGEEEPAPGTRDATRRTAVTVSSAPTAATNVSHVSWSRESVSGDAPAKMVEHTTCARRLGRVPPTGMRRLSQPLAAAPPRGHTVRSNAKPCARAEMSSHVGLYSSARARARCVARLREGDGNVGSVVSCAGGDLVHACERAHRSPSIRASSQRTTRTRARVTTAKATPAPRRFVRARRTPGTQ